MKKQVKTKEMTLKEIEDFVRYIQNNAELLQDYTYINKDAHRITYEYRKDDVSYSLHFDIRIAKYVCVFEYTSNGVTRFTAVGR